MPTQSPSLFQNPHLAGEPFFWAGGPVGVILAHGFTATTAEVRPLGRILHECGYTVAGPLLPGHGSDPHDLNRVRWQDWAGAMENCYQDVAARCEKVFLGGESTGGLLALYLASLHPEAAGILAYAPVLRLNQSVSRRLLLRLAAPFLPWIAKTRRDDSMPWQGYTVYPLKGALQLLKLQRVVRGRLARVRQPLLIVQGRKDLTVHPSSPIQIFSQVASTTKEMVWIPDSTHCVILDRELEKVADITLQFLHNTSS